MIPAPQWGDAGLFGNGNAEAADIPGVGIGNHHHIGSQVLNVLKTGDDHGEHAAVLVPFAQIGAVHRRSTRI